MEQEFEEIINKIQKAIIKDPSLVVHQTTYYTKQEPDYDRGYIAVPQSIRSIVFTFPPGLISEG